MARQHQINVALSETERRRLEEIARDRGIKTTEVLRYLLWNPPPAPKEKP